MRYYYGGEYFHILQLKEGAHRLLKFCYSLQVMCILERDTMYLIARSPDEPILARGIESTEIPPVDKLLDIFNAIDQKIKQSCKNGYGEMEKIIAALELYPEYTIRLYNEIKRKAALNKD